MHATRGTGYALFIAGLLALLTLSAQPARGQTKDQAAAAPAKSSTPLSDQQLRGEALFVQNCPLCHIPSRQKKELGIQGPVLQGMFSEDSDADHLRQVVEQGIPGKMPGFRYTLDSKQMDDLIAFLKAGAVHKAPGVAN